MRRIALLVIACGLMSPPAAYAVDRDFKDIVSAIADEFRTQPTRIPLFGLVNGFMFMARPAGARHIDIAVFENLDHNLRRGRDLSQVVRDAVGRGWTPFIQVRSRRGHGEEVVFVYMRPEGKNCRLLVTSIEPDEATVVQLKLNPEALRRWVDTPREAAFHPTGWDDDDK
jgi:hypothetical protein